MKEEMDAQGRTELDWNMYHSIYYHPTWEDARRCSKVAREFASQSRWISCEERLPEGSGSYLVCSPSGEINIASWRESYKIFTCQNKYEDTIGWHWQVIGPPKK